MSAKVKPVSLTWIAIDRFENGKIVEAWVEWDLLGATITLPQTAS